MTNASWPRPAQAGYALISALWLLLLCASVAAVLMMQAVQSSKAVAAERIALVKLAAEESALETAAGDLLMNGTSSRFAVLPSTATYRIGGQAYRVEGSRESEQIDINGAPLALIDAELRMASVEPAIRSALVASLDRNRRMGSRIESVAEIMAFAPDASCVGSVLTPYDGRTAAATTGGIAGLASLSVGPTAWRLRIAGSGATRTVIVRAGLAGQSPVQVVEATFLQDC